VPGRHLVQGDLCVGAAPPGGGDAGRGRFQHQPGGPGAGPVRDPGGALRQGDAVKPTAAAAGGHGDAVGGGGGRGRPGGGGSAAECLAEVSPRYGMPGHPALWLTERGGRVSVRLVDERFAAYRDAARLPRLLTPHCLRHSYVSHLIEDGADPVFVQHQVGHSWASTTAGYASVGADHANRMLRAALDRAFTGTTGGGTGQ